MGQQTNPEQAHARCPSCGSSPLPEFTEPRGMALCPRCGTLLRRTDHGLHAVGLSTEGLTRLVQAKLNGTDPDLVRIQERITARVAAQLGVDPSAVPPQYRWVDELGADSLDVVELVMAVEEEFGIELGAS
jgi:acyl carrier protein